MERQHLGEKVWEETEVSVVGEVECLEEIRLELIFTGIFIGLDVVVHFVQFSPDIHGWFEISRGWVFDVRGIWCSMSEPLVTTANDGMNRVNLPDCHST